jgi:hypothetical protein
MLTMQQPLLCALLSGFCNDLIIQCHVLASSQTQCSSEVQTRCVGNAKKGKLIPSLESSAHNIAQCGASRLCHAQNSTAQHSTAHMPLAISVGCSIRNICDATCPTGRCSFLPHLNVS